MVRRAARNRLYTYAEFHRIIDFADSALVPQRHRDTRQRWQDQAAARATAINEAADVDAVLAIFDQVSSYLR